MIKQTYKTGFGLMEVLFSVGIFIVVVGSLVSLNRLALRNAVLTAHRAQAYNLAQDGLEAIRQMRDTTWIDGILPTGADETNEWLAYAHDCTTGDPNNYSPVNFMSTYEICFDTTAPVPGGPPFNRFGLTPVDFSQPSVTSATNPDSFIVLAGSDSQPDPGAPPYYKRTVTFEQVPATTALGDGSGLQLFTGDDAGIVPAANIETYHFMKAKVLVEWTDFDKTWNVTVSTLLTNWRSK